MSNKLEQTPGERLARMLFELGDEPGSPCQRIEFKGGQYPKHEKSQGGMCESALGSWLDRALAELAKTKKPT